jgi:hypothetical protein
VGHTTTRGKGKLGAHVPVLPLPSSPTPQFPSCDAGRASECYVPPYPDAATKAHVAAGAVKGELVTTMSPRGAVHGEMLLAPTKVQLPGVMEM